MSNLKCPCCGSDDLDIENVLLENGQYHYRARCAECATEFRNPRFDGINAVVAFFEDAASCGESGEEW